MSSLKIPFGKHKITGVFYDAGSVANGLKCDCICKECDTSPEAVHPKLNNRQQYFRHAANPDCRGGLESLYHQVAKQILKDSNELRIAEKESFPYYSCDIETPRHGKQPDAFICNDTSSMIVEILFTHDIDNRTLDTYLANGERVLEIDRSGERKKLLNYNQFTQLVLGTAPRKLYSRDYPPSISPGTTKNTPWWLVPLLFIGGILLLRWLHRRKKSRKRKSELRFRQKGSYQPK